jgi:ribosomal protein S15P/S13E
MYLTLNQAAKETGKSKGTISRYIKSGKLSFVEKTERGYKLDPSEVFRVFQKVKPQTGNIEQSETPLEHQKNSLLEQQVTFLNEKIALLENHLEKSEQREQDLSAKLDKAQSTIERQTHLISDMREKSPERPVERSKKFLGIFPLSAR